MGHKPEVDGSLAMMATALLGKSTVEGIEHALRRCMDECRFPVRLPDIVVRIPGREVPAIDAEMRAAWDVLTRFVSKWGRWGEDYQHAYVEKGAPTLPARITDTVRRTGGWGAYLILSYTDADRARDAQFQQKRFFEEYQAWTAVEQVLPDLAKVLQLPASRVLQLVKPMEAPPKQVINVNHTIPRAPIPPPTPDQLQDRLADQKARLAQYLRDHPELNKSPRTAGTAAAAGGEGQDAARKDAERAEITRYMERAAQCD